MRTSPSLLAALPALLLAGHVSAGCNADNCLRALRATRIPGRLETAQAFCSTFTATSVAATAIPSFAVDACKDNQNGPLAARLSSACSCIATPTTSTTATATPTGNPKEPCAVVSSSWAAQASAGVAVPTVAAALAYDCLNSVPLHRKEALEFVDALAPYMEWQSDPAYKAAPPPEYPWPAYDMFAALDAVKTGIQTGTYKNEYSWQIDMYTSVFGRGHDGHFVVYVDLMSRAFDFNRQRSLVSISEDGSSLPVIKIYEDVIASPSTASVVTHINGKVAADYVQGVINQASWNKDLDAAYNSMFYSKAIAGGGNGNGFFGSGGRIRYIYQGPNTTFTFANGTEATYENFARVKASFAGVNSGETMYSKFCTPVPTGAVAQAQAAPAAGAVVPGYPAPLASTDDNIVSCYFLDGDEFKDVVVISLLSFENESPPEFQSVTKECIAKATAAGKTKLVVDFQANGGGYILHGYDFFRTLFPKVVQDGNSRWKENGGFNAISEIFSDIVEGVDPWTSGDSDLVTAYETWFNWRYDLNLTNGNFLSFADKFAPQIHAGTPYTDLMRWNLSDPLTTVNATYGLGIEITGYGTLANEPQPFAPENIVMLLDGWCASTCTLAAEFLRIHGGVKSVALGGRPQPGKIDGVGGIKGSQTLSYSGVQYYVGLAAAYAKTDAQKAELARYTSLPIERTTAAALNTRDQILPANVADGVPAEFLREEADCRLYWTPNMVTDITAVWKATASAAFNGGKCAAGGIAKRDVDGSELARRYLPAPVRPSGGPIRRGLNGKQSAMWMEKNSQRAVV